VTFEFNKRAELFVGLHNETLSVVAMRVSNLNCLRSEETEMPRLTYHHSPITYHFLRIGAVSSVVERLVYTERVGGSNPSPPSFQLPIVDLRLRLNTSRKHMSDGGFDMNLCCVKKWDAVMDRIAKN
jgi:hypothetical protein